MGHMVASVIIYESIFSSLPSTLRTINISEYLERLYNDFNGTKTLIPKKLNSKLTNFFSDDFYWTKGNGIISDVQYDKQPQDNFLVVKTFGWNPLRNELMKLKLRVFANGIELKYSHKDKNSYYFVLDKNVMQINEIQINSSTFIPTMITDSLELMSHQ
jgi:hypothetical protein